MPLTPEQLQDAYRQMHVIRKFEEAIRNLYQQGKIRGSFHPCVGQEATAVGGCWALRKDDYMTCTYRGHGQAIAKGLSVRAAMATRSWPTAIYRTSPWASTPGSFGTARGSSSGCERTPCAWSAWRWPVWGPTAW